MSLSALEYLEKVVNRHSRNISIYVEVENVRSFKAVFRKLDDLNCHVNETDLNAKEAFIPGGIGFILSTKMPKNAKKESVISDLEEIDGVIFIDEI